MGQRADARIADFMSKVRDRFQIDQAILFGSRARGDELVDSDYDVILVSRDFQDVFFSQRSALMYDFWSHWPIEIEPLCYTPEEFETKKKQIGIVSEAIKEGIPV
jgi:predicted nucleotidyltransferase